MNNKVSCEIWGAYLIRLALGVVFLAHGIQKFTAIDMTAQFFVSLGLTAFVGYLVALTETLAGLAFILGLYVRYAAYAAVIIMIGAIAFVARKAGFFGGWEYELVLLLVALGIALAPTNSAVCPCCCVGVCKGHDKK